MREYELIDHGAEPLREPDDWYEPEPIPYEDCPACAENAGYRDGDRFHCDNCRVEIEL